MTHRELGAAAAAFAAAEYHVLATQELAERCPESHTFQQLLAIAEENRDAAYEPLIRAATELERIRQGAAA